LNVIDYDELWERVSDLFIRVPIDSPFGIPFASIDKLISSVKEAQDKLGGLFCFDWAAFSSIY